MVRLRYPRLGVLAMELLLTPPKVGVGVYSPVARLSGYLGFVCWLVCLCRRRVGGSLAGKGTWSRLWL